MNRLLLLFQILGAGLGLVAVGALLRRRPATPDLAPALLVVGVAAIVTGGTAWGAFKEVDALRTREKTPRATAEVAAGVDQPFFAWAAERMGESDTFAVVPEMDEAPFAFQWLTYQLLPRRLVAADKARWLVFYKVAPEAAEYDRGAFSEPELFTPDLGIAERRDAG